MLEEYPLISVIIPHRKNDSIESSLEQIAKVDYPQERIEVFTVVGDQPSVQRNACIKESSGSIIYFLDNDSEIEPENFKLAVETFKKNPRISVVGGPSCARLGDSQIQNEFTYCLSSYICVGPISHRYKASGVVHKATEKELILCNMLIRHSTLKEVGLFNEELYPNEENELMDRIDEAGYEMIYHPGVVIHRSPRPNYISFIKMLISYGKGRFKHFTVYFRWVDTVFLIPAIFSLYIASLPFSQSLPNSLANFYYLPAIFYSLITAAFCCYSFFKFKEKKYRVFLTLPFLFFSVHFFYGLGILIGFFQLFVKKKQPVFYEVTKRK